MEDVRRILCKKELSFAISGDKPPDISPLSIGDARGKMNALVTPFGLAIAP